MKLSVRPSIPPYAAANARWNSSAFPVNKTPLAPSAVLLVGMDGFIKPPCELTADEINGLIQQFVQTAKIAEQAGFSGVQIHAAHGYLISQFLSPYHNRRRDQWGGSLENRSMRFLLETHAAIRAAVGKDFLVGVKLNSADFQKAVLTKANQCRWYKSYRKWALILLKFPVETTKARKCSPPKTAPANAKPSSSITLKKPVQSAKPADYHQRLPFANHHGRRTFQRSFGFGRRRPSVCLSP